MSLPTLTELRTAVAAKGYSTTNPGIDDVINTAYREVAAAKRWPFLESTSTSLTTTAGNGTVALSGIVNLLHVDAVRIYGPDPAELDFLTTQEIRSMANFDRATDVPDYWARQGNTLLLYPLPAAVYTLTVDYIVDITPLVGTSDTVVIPRLYMDTIVWGAAAELAHRQRDYASADRAERKRDDAVARMSRAYGMEQRQGGRTVRETGFWDDQA